MPLHDAEIAAALDRVADLLEIRGENPFRVRAYRTAARTVATLPRPVTEMLDAGEDLDALPGIGADLAGKIETLARTGELPLLRELEAAAAPGLTELLTLPGLGPRRVQRLFQELGVRDLAGLRAACEGDRIAALRGFGPRSQARILEALAQRDADVGTRRVLWKTADDIAGALIGRLQALPGVDRAVVAGSYRRGRDTVGDLDVLVTSDDPAGVMGRVVADEEVREVMAHGDTRATVRLRSGLQVDVRVVEPAAYGAALHYFTGSKAHDIAIRKRGVARGLKINEYGVWRDDERVAGATEEEVYAQVDLPWIPPELREDRGEIEAAEQRRLPRLVRLEDIRGDLHVHSTATDGRDTLSRMVEAARALGYAYLASTEHTRNVRVAGGLGAAEMHAHLDAVEALAATVPDVRILRSAEVDILPDGSLDLPDDVLARMDIVVCAVHDPARQDRATLTERVLRAMDRPWFDILAHPTGRLIGTRAPYPLDLERVMRGAVERGCYLEVNAQPDRMDLDDVACRMAHELGLKVAIDTDAHGAGELSAMRLGVTQARRGWLEAEDVINTRSWPELRRLLRKRP